MFFDEEPTTRELAIALVARPAKLLFAQGLSLSSGGFFMLVIWLVPPIVDGAVLDIESIIFLGVGLLSFGWGSLICFGAIRMKSLASHKWAVAGAVLSLLPFLIGIYVLVVLKNPIVVAAFEEVAAGLSGDGDEYDFQL